jgi:hypothetical protein
MTDTTIPRKRGRPRSTLSDAEGTEQRRVYLRDYQLERRSKNREALNAKSRERRDRLMSENPEAVLLAERERTQRSRAKRRT